jgi:hypothetical protein
VWAACPRADYAAKSFLYEGPVDQAQVDPNVNSPRIEFKVRFSKNKTKATTTRTSE